VTTRTRGAAAAGPPLPLGPSFFHSHARGGGRGPPHTRTVHPTGCGGRPGTRARRPARRRPSGRVPALVGPPCGLLPGEPQQGVCEPCTTASRTSGTGRWPRGPALRGVRVAVAAPGAKGAWRCEGGGGGGTRRALMPLHTHAHAIAATVVSRTLDRRAARADCATPCSACTSSEPRQRMRDFAIQQARSESMMGEEGTVPGRSTLSHPAHPPPYRQAAARAALADAGRSRGGPGT